MNFLEKNIILFGAHCDDIEIGCGGLISRFGIDDTYSFTFVIGTNINSERTQEQLNAFSYISDKYKSVKNLIILDYEIQSLQLNYNKLRNEIEDLLYKENKRYSCFVHFPDDTHIDHRTLSSAVTDAARELSIIYYQSPSSYDFKTNLYVTLSEEHLNEKLKFIEFHNSQIVKNDGLFLNKVKAQAAYHAISTYEKYAEGYFIHKLKF
jgi:LmbE family N-acetylglucosaminyl deacetylase